MGRGVDHAKDSERSLRVAGSCNGLVCVSLEFEFGEPSEFDEPPEVDELAPPEVDELAITNPLTREVKILPMPRPYPPEVPVNVCCGFGYDSSLDDYKVIVGFTKTHGQKRTLFHVFTLKSNTWNVIGEIKYGCTYDTFGAFCGGALHWFMECDADQKVIISLDLTTLEFKETPDLNVTSMTNASSGL
ncbi:F-box/kelch-repeat protein At3g06240-like [Bidens hawaiensis]|uniref:F-box/kelch-repeat protein At3g06240-like n=1 Tax=Bidens hawaiensis TaxID=980011 RepID=UPI00404965AA